MFDEDLRPFLADFGRPCVSEGTPFKALFDQPDQIFNNPRADAHSRQYKLTYVTADVVLKRDQAVTVSGTAYTVRSVPEQLDDGAFSSVLLSKV